MRKIALEYRSGPSTPRYGWLSLTQHSAPKVAISGTGDTPSVPSALRSVSTAIATGAFLVLTGCAQSDDPCAGKSQIARLNCSAHIPADTGGLFFRDSLSVERTSSIEIDSAGNVVGGSVVR